MNWFNDYRKSIIIVILLAVFAMEGLVQAATITVGPARGNYDFNKIQNAIDAAEDGDEVLVAPKEYDIIEPITFRGKAITVRSEAGPYGTTIQMSEVPEDWETDYALVLFNNEEDSRSLLEGFTIKDSFERGITCINSSPRIENCMFISNLASGIQCLSASPIINNIYTTRSSNFEYFSKPNFLNIFCK